MSKQYITGSYSGIVLGQGDYGSPFTVGSLAAIGLHPLDTTSSATGIDAGVGYAASVVNYGYVYGHTNGIGLAGGGGVANTELNGIRSNDEGQIYGAIYGHVNGVSIDGGGTVTNNSGVIKGIKGDGILITGGYGSVYNDGTVRGDINDARTIGVGIYLAAGGTVTNGATGVVDASDAGIKVAGGAGNLVVNFGVVESGGPYGVNLQYGTVTNAADGLIDSLKIGVALQQGTLLNNGFILVESSGEYKPNGAAVVRLVDGGYVSNGASGSIYAQIAADGVLGQSGVSTVENAGTISADDAVVLKGGGTVLNSGSIVGTGQYGVYINLTHQNADHPNEVRGYISNASSATTTGYYAVYAKGTVSLGTGSTSPALNLVNSGTLDGSGTGVKLEKTSGSLTNSTGGTIEGAGAHGISLHESDGVISNAAGALISGGTGGDGVYALFSNLTLTNDGTITDPLADGQDGVRVLGNSYNAVSYAVVAYITNQADGTISGADGIFLNVATGSVSNEGHIAGADVGVSLQGGDLTLYNAASGTITGGTIGVSASGQTRLENAGTIIGTGGTAVYLSGNGDRMIVDAGASFSGIVEVKAGDVGTLELASGASAGTIHGLGAEYVGFGSVTIDSGATWDIAGTVAGFGGVAIDGFNSDDRLDLTDLTFDSADTATLNGSNQLVITDAGGNITLGIDGGVSGQQFVLSDDGDGGTFVEAPGIVGPGSTVSGLFASHGNSILISSGGTAVNDTIGAGGFEIVLSGGIASGTHIGKGGQETVSSGGKSIGAVVSSGGTETVLTGGTASGVTVKAGGVLIYGGGKITGATVTSGGKEVIAAGVTVSGLTVGNGVNLTVSSGATAKATTLSGGTDTILGTASGTTVVKGGTEIVSGSGKSIGAVISTGGTEKVLTGGTASAITVKAGGTLTISAGGTASGAVLSGAADSVLGIASATTILTGGTETVSAGGKSVGAIVSSGGTETVLTGGTASDTVVKAGGTLVFAGGTVSGATVSSGATLTVSSGATASKPTVVAGGVITDLGHTISATVRGTIAGTKVTSGLETVSAKAIASATTVATGGVLIVSSGGTAIGTVLSGGTENVLSGGVISGPVIFNGTGDTLSITGTKPAALIVSGFVKTDTIDLASFASKSAKLSFVEAKTKTSGTLTITDGTLKASVTLFGNYVANGFKLSADGAGTAITYTSATGAHEELAVSHT